MANITTNYNLTKPAQDESYNVDVQNNNMEIIDEALKGLEDTISNTEVITPAVGFGMNNVIKNTGKTPTYPRFTLKGRTLINILGRDGNCEDVSKWATYLSTLTLDSTNKVFGSNSIKITVTATGGCAIRYVTFDASKYYCLSGYVKNGNATSMKLSVHSDGGATYDSATVTDATKFNPVFIKFAGTPIANGSSSRINAIVTGSNGQYGYIDGVMLEEITAEQYNDPNFVPSPYVDSYTNLTNPYVEIRHNNLFRNGNTEEGISWWKVTNGTGSIAIKDTYFLITDTSSTEYLFVDSSTKVKGGTNYSYRYIAKAGTIPMRVVILYCDKFGNYISQTADIVTSATIDTTITGTIVTPSNADYVVFRCVPHNGNTSDTGYAYIKEIMLVEGTTPPTEYKPCEIQRTVIEGQFTTDDEIVYENGEVTGLLHWNHRTLFGKDYDWRFNNDGTLSGVKKITLQMDKNTVPNSNSGSSKANIVEIKYDGKIIPTTDWGTLEARNDDTCYINEYGIHYLLVKDTDTGWTETISPNGDEVKAFMNGWRALSYNTTRYVAWWNITDSSNPQTSTTGYPAGTTTTLTVATNATASITVSDTSKFKAGDIIAVYGDIFRTISSISGNVITLSTTVPTGYAIGNVVLRADSADSSDARLINYCKNNIAPGYEGYMLHYKLQNPEPITDINVHIEGDTPTLDVGDNYVYLDSGIVLGEVANPYIIGGFTYWNNTLYPTSKLKVPNEIINSIYKNNIYESNMMNLKGTATNSYGNQRWSIVETLYDSNATYTVDYKILTTQAPTIGEISCSYGKSITEVIENIAGELENRQLKDSALDTLIDLSIYERQDQPDYYYILPFVYCYNALYIEFRINFNVIKKVLPNITYSNVSILRGTSGIESINTFSLNRIFVTKQYAILRFITTNATVISDIRTNGAFGKLGTIIADCKDKI